MSTRSGVLEKYVEIARSLDAGRSLREASKDLGIPFSTATDVIRAMEDRYGVQLVVKDHAKTGDARLTEDGQELFRRVERLLEWSPLKERPSLTIAMPQSILDSQIVSHGLRNLIEQPGSVGIELQVRAATEVTRICAEIESGAIDVGVVWIADRERVNEVVNARGIAVEVSPQPFRVIAVTNSIECHDELMRALHREPLQSTPDFSKAAAYFRTKRIALMPRESQAYHDSLLLNPAEAPDRSTCIRVDTLTAAITSVAMRVADIAFIPYLRSVMRQHYFSGSLCWSQPLGRIDLAILYSSRRVGDRRVREAISRIQLLSAAEAQSGIDDICKTAAFPTDIAVFERLRMGYYIDIDRLPEHDDSPLLEIDRATHWRWETLALTGILPEGIAHGIQSSLPGVDGVRLTGQVKNRFGHAFAVEAHASLDPRYGRVIAVASQDDVRLTAESVPGFVTVLNRCVQLQDKSLALSGVWMGFDRDDPTAVYATIWSERTLSQKELEMIASATMPRAVLLTDCDHKFDEQPIRT